MQIPILAIVSGPVIIYDNDDKPDHLAVLVAFRKCIVYVLETIVECLLAPMVEDNDNNNNNDDKEEMEEVKKL